MHLSIVRGLYLGNRDWQLCLPACALVFLLELVLPLLLEHNEFIALFDSLVEEGDCAGARDWNGPIGLDYYWLVDELLWLLWALHRWFLPVT